MAIKTGVLHIIDSLTVAGAEHVAVTLANNLPQESYRAYLCASRKSGPLQKRLRPHVVFFDLRRRGRFDFFAIMRLSNFVRRERIQIIHAHSTSLFLGSLLCILNPSLRLIWHDHYGFHEKQTRPVFLYSPFARQARVVFSVTRQLANWSIDALGIPGDRVIYMPNFVEVGEISDCPHDLPGEDGKRIVCVANVRRQKDHLTLVDAMSKIVQVEPQAHLLLVGEKTDAHLTELIQKQIFHAGLSRNVTWMGTRQDVAAILKNCDIGVLSSVSEGFPVVLLEYGRAGLAVVATKVGECVEILEDGNAGMLVSPSNPNSLASAIMQFLISADLRARYGERLKGRIENNYSVDIIVLKICKEYDRVLKK